MSQPTSRELNVLVSANSDKDKIVNDLRPIILDYGGRWDLGADFKSLERVFRFKTFKAAWVGYS
jgi:hypothetical protein